MPPLDNKLYAAAQGAGASKLWTWLQRLRNGFHGCSQGSIQTCQVTALRSYMRVRWVSAGASAKRMHQFPSCTQRLSSFHLGCQLGHCQGDRQA